MKASTLIRPLQELKAVAKITLQSGQTQTVSLTLGMRAFAAYDDVRRAWVAEAGRFEVRLGASSADISQRAWVTLSTEWVDLVNREPTRFIIRVLL
jgi:beta-glucosidase